MPQEIYSHSLSNGLTVIAERMPHVRSAAFQFLLPAGASHDAHDRLGVAALTSDLMTRGAGKRNNRELTEALDSLGVDRGESAGIVNIQLAGSTLSRCLVPALEIYADIIQRPHLPEAELPAAKSLSLQDLQGTDDEPQRRVSIELRKRFYPDPLGRDARGSVAGVEATTIEDVRAHHAKHFVPNGAILSIAGDIDWPQLRGEVERLFGDWKPGDRAPLPIGAITPESAHLEKDLDQTQIAFAIPSVPMGHADFYTVRGMVGVLSHDMSSRLFTNVREKHGLCYSVYAGHESFKDRGAIVGYAGARPELAQETLDRTLAEFRNLTNGIDQDEIDRVKIGLKSALIMRQESTAARASSLATDWYFLGRVRRLEEVQAAIESLSVAAILNYVERTPMRGFTVVSLGKSAVTAVEN